MLPPSEIINKASSFLKGLASEHRLAILCALGDAEVCVSDIQKQTGMHQTSVSQHLLKLKKEGIVDFRRDHRTLYYFVSNEKAKKILRMFCDDYLQD